MVFAIVIRKVRGGLIAAILVIAGFAVSPWAASATPPAWMSVPSPNQGTNQLNFLRGVACPSSTSCWAVGEYNNGTINQTLIEHYNGTWAIASSPNFDTTHSNFLAGVTCVSLNDCWAVGRHFIGSTTQTLAEHYDGVSWKVVTTTNPNPGQNNTLDAVTCVSTSDCWAVGHYIGTDGFIHTLTEHYNGTWSTVTSANTSASQANTLLGVTCTATNNCWAVGDFISSGTTHRTLIELWNGGTSWSLASPAPPNMGTGSNFLRGVACVNASNCWAVGYFVSGSVNQTLTEQFNGTSWSIVASQNSSASESNILLAVTCASATECWAVGGHTQTGSDAAKDQTLIELFNGTAWSIVPSPSTSSFQANDLEAVTCITASDCWAVGAYVNNPNSSGTGVDQTLTEHFTAPSSPVIPDIPWPPLAMLAVLAGAVAIRWRAVHRTG